MITRRTLLKGSLLAGGFVRSLPAAFARAAQPQTAIAFDVPAEACDCHVHVFGDPARFPFSPTRAYTPEGASLDELRALQRALHLERVVIIQPSVYDTDNSCTLDAIARLGPKARGVAVIDERTSEEAIKALRAGGMRGLRLNFATNGVTDPSAARRQLLAAIARARPHDWHVQLNTRLNIVAALHGDVLASAVPVVFDNFGGARAEGGPDQPGFKELVSLVKSGRAYVKIAAAPDAAKTPAAYAVLARELVAANPQRILWGTNWPHPGSSHAPGRLPTDIAPLVQTDDGRVLNLLPSWVPDPATRRAILVDNPAKLYGF
jgi:predicted TIM-barrel fold metal-dependent hydrolase